MTGHENKNGQSQQTATDQDSMPPKPTEARHHNWVTDLYDRANLTVRQLNIMAIALLALIFVLFVIFGK